MEAGRVVSVPPLAFFELCLKAGRVVSLRQNTDEVDSQSIQSRLIVDSNAGWVDSKVGCFAATKHG